MPTRILSPLLPVALGLVSSAGSRFCESFWGCPLGQQFPDVPPPSQVCQLSYLGHQFPNMVTPWEIALLGLPWSRKFPPLSGSRRQRSPLGHWLLAVVPLNSLWETPTPRGSDCFLWATLLHSHCLKSLSSWFLYKSVLSHAVQLKLRPREAKQLRSAIQE